MQTVASYVTILLALSVVGVKESEADAGTPATGATEKIGAAEAFPTADMEWPPGPRVLRELIDDLSSRSGFAYVLAGDLGSQHLERRVRVPAFRGPAYQAALLTAELGGIDLLFLDGLMVWLPAGECPLVLSAAQRCRLDRRARADGFDREGILTRRADVTLVDASLSFAAQTVSRAFAVPVVLSEEARGTQVLVSLDGTDRSLEEVLDRVAESCGVTSSVRAGIVWWRVDSGSPSSHVSTDGARPEPVLRWCGATAAELAGRLQEAGALPSEWSASAADGADAIDVAGPLEDVAEAFALARAGVSAAGAGDEAGRRPRRAD